jgi:hypothetical protein
MNSSVHDDTQKMPRPQLSTADFFKAEIDELEAINEMIQKFIQIPSPEGKVRIKAHLVRWLKNDRHRAS